MASFLASHFVQRHINWQPSRLLILLLCSLQLAACSSSRYISQQADKNILGNNNFTAAHVGISIYDPSSDKYLYTHQAEKYFIPASNTKLYTCYSAMKHLGDSLVGLQYYNNTDTSILAFATGDPTLLLPAFSHQPVYEFLKQTPKKIFLSLNWKEAALGNGWAWNDYDADYMAERSALPVMGNLLTMEGNASNWWYYPVVNGIRITEDATITGASRTVDSNFFRVHFKPTGNQQYQIPFKTREGLLNIAILENVLKKNISVRQLPPVKGLQKIYSQPTDSLLKPMMHRSDNFFAEQTLLMVSNEMTGVMDDAKIIDSLLKTDLKDLPQKPRWVDGSGLSRYNLFSPNDFVFLLNKMKTEFSWNRITTILPTGGEGTLSNYYLPLRNRIFAKTGSLSNNLALSGFLITKKNKTLIFSVLVNNHMGNATQIRKAVEQFLVSVAEKN